MPSRPPGQDKVKGSTCSPVSKHDLELVEHQVPVLAPGFPVLHDALGGQIKHPAQRIVVDKAGLVLRDLPELAVKALDNIGRIYDFPDFRRVFIEGAQNIPVILPAFHAGGVLLAPLFSEVEPQSGKTLFLNLKER